MHASLGFKMVNSTAPLSSMHPQTIWELLHHKNQQACTLLTCDFQLLYSLLGHSWGVLADQHSMLVTQLGLDYTSAETQNQLTL
jgi:hypothetical protein